MNRRRRTEILIKGNADVAEKIAGEIQNKYKVEKIQEPENGLVMIKMRENAKNSLFYIGEVLVTECKVRIKGKLGNGIVNGDNSELALNLAIIDAAYNAKLDETIEWNKLLKKEEIKIKERLIIEQSKILKTKVDFDTMSV